MSVLCTVNSDAMAQLVGRLSGIRRLPTVKRGEIDVRGEIDG